MLKVSLQERTVFSPNDLTNGYIAKCWWPELKLDLNLEGIIADFYLFYAVKDGSSYLRQKFEDYAQVVAKQIAVYLDASIGGELRHKDFAGLGEWNRPLARREWRVKRTEQGISILEGGRSCFHNEMWKGGFGGEAWGKIADLLVSHLKGEVSSSLFVDQSFALEHNTATVFNKLESYWKQDSLKTVLDANLHERWDVLLQYASEWAKTIFLNWLVEEDSITIKGITHSRPRLVDGGYKITTGTEVGVGQMVRVSDRSRAKGWQGREGKIVKISKARLAMVLLDGAAKDQQFTFQALRAIDSDEISEGSRVRVGHRAHSKALRGREGKVIRTRVADEVVVESDGVRKGFNLTNLDIIEKAPAFREYIG